MASEVLVVLAVGVVATLVVVGVTFVLVVRRVRRSLEEASTALEQLEPRIERFQQDNVVRARELDRLHTAFDRRADRPRRGV